MAGLCRLLSHFEFDNSLQPLQLFKFVYAADVVVMFMGNKQQINDLASNNTAVFHHNMDQSLYNAFPLLRYTYFVLKEG